MGSPILTDFQQAHYQDWVDKNKGLLGLQGWEIDVQTKPTKKGDIAAMHSRIQSNAARLFLSKDFLELPRERQRQTLVHELLHCVTRDLFCLTAEAFSHEQYHHFENVHERTIDAIAFSVAQMFPVP